MNSVYLLYLVHPFVVRENNINGCILYMPRAVMHPVSGGKLDEEAFVIILSITLICLVFSLLQFSTFFLFSNQYRKSVLLALDTPL